MTVYALLFVYALSIGYYLVSFIKRNDKFHHHDSMPEDKNTAYNLSGTSQLEDEELLNKQRAERRQKEIDM